MELNYIALIETLQSTNYCDLPAHKSSEASYCIPNASSFPTIGVESLTFTAAWAADAGLGYQTISLPHGHTSSHWITKYKFCHVSSMS